MFYMIMIQNVPWREGIAKNNNEKTYKEIVITAASLINSLWKIIKERL